uniref:Uncharacterized protein n=1 Tax=Arundo donax TaxID=35708 RepID=A0A0A9HLI7_ARUDO
MIFFPDCCAGLYRKERCDKPIGVLMLIKT